jgi:hypothetical protein
MKLLWPAVLTVLAVFASGCAEQPVTGPQPEASSTNSSSVAESPTPLPEKTKPRLDELVVYPGGIDYVKVGTAFDQPAAELAIALYNPAPCSGDEPDYIVGWQSTYDESGLSFVSNPDSTIRGIAIQNSGPRTAEGLGVGSTDAEILAVYGSGASKSAQTYTDLYSVVGADGVLVFEVANGTDPDSDVQAGVVVHMLVLGPDAVPFSIYRSGYGPCH